VRALPSSHIYLPTFITSPPYPLSFFFFNPTPPTEIYTLSLHDALPILRCVIHPDAPGARSRASWSPRRCARSAPHQAPWRAGRRSEEHTSELQSRGHLVCRLLLEKKKNNSE